MLISKANHLLLNLLERLIEENGEKDRRFRLVHAQVMQDEDIARMGELGVIAEVQPIHASDDMRWMEERIGTERSRGAYAFNRTQVSGAVLSFGTDWPGTAAAEYHISPMYGLYAAITRKTMTGEPEGGWFPEERITMQTLNTLIKKKTVLHITHQNSIHVNSDKVFKMVNGAVSEEVGHDSRHLSDPDIFTGFINV